MTLGVPVSQRGNPIDHLGQVLAARGELLLVLDNFEQLVGDCASVVRGWASSAGALTLVVTSRQRLGVDGEVVVALEPLSERDAVSLFEDRVSRLRRALPTDRRSVTRLVSALDRLPLSIELAAARTTVLSPEAMLERLEHRIDFLVRAGGDDQGTPSLRAAIDESWALLAPAERLALSQCSVFRGGFDLDAAEAVLDLSGVEDAPKTLDAIQALVDKSLLYTFYPANAPTTVRIAAYETIAGFASERLAESGEEAAAERRHAIHYGRQSKPWAREGWQRSSPEILDRIALDLDNLLTVVRRALESDSVPMDSAIFTWLAAHPVLWVRTRARPHLGLLEGLVKRATGTKLQPALVARLHVSCGWTYWRLGQNDDALRILETARELAHDVGDPDLLADTLAVLARVADEVGEWSRALTLCKEALRVRPEHGIARYLLGATLRRLGSLDEATEQLEQALVLNRRVANRYFEACCLTSLGNLALGLNRTERARKHFSEAMTVGEKLGQTVQVRLAAGAIGWTHHMDGDLSAARLRYERAAEDFREVGERRLEGVFRSYLAGVLIDEHRFDEAEHQVRIGLRLADEVRDEPSQAKALFLLARIHAARAELDVARRLVERGKGLLVRDPHQLPQVELYRTFFDALAKRDYRTLSKARAEVRSFLSTDCPFFAIRLTAASIERALGHLDMLAVSSDGQWITGPDGHRVSLRTRPVLRRLVAELARNREGMPGETVPPEALAEAAWPGERMLEAAKANRLKWALSTLRKLGLKDALQRVDGGYRLDPDGSTVCAETDLSMN
jgi:predicted ATPase/predicted negative regulator of RcsB-dependent stress response